MDELSLNIEKITSEILILKQQTAQNIIEIGKRLTQVKMSLPHGEWEDYLKDKVQFSQMTATRFMKVAEESPNLTSLLDLGITKVYALLELPPEERKEFIKKNPVVDMTTRELQKAIKAKKELEDKLKDTEKQKNEFKRKYLSQLNKSPKVIPPKDYEQIKKKLAEYKTREDLNEVEASEYRKLKDQIEKLKKEKNDFARKLDSVTELSGLVVEVENFLKVKLSPVKYSRSIYEQKNDPIVQENLKDIVDRVQQWCNEIYQLLDVNYIDVEEIKDELGFPKQ